MIQIRILDKNLREVEAESIGLEAGVVTIILSEFVATKPEAGKVLSNSDFMDRLRGLPTLCPMKPGSGLSPWR